MGRSPQRDGCPGGPPCGREEALRELSQSLGLAEKLQRILPEAGSSGHIHEELTVAGYLVREFRMSVSRAMSILTSTPEADGLFFADGEIGLRGAGGKIPYARKVVGASTKRRRAEERTTVSTSRPLDDDGFTWKKYGHKAINAAKYPRSYFKCSQWSLNGCPATKQVQQNDIDPTKFVVTYINSHTCQLPLDIDSSNEPFSIDFKSGQRGGRRLLPSPFHKNSSSSAANSCFGSTVLPAYQINSATELRDSTCSNECRHSDLDFVPPMGDTPLTRSTGSCDIEFPIFHSASPMSSDISAVVDDGELIDNLFCYNDEELLLS